MSGTAKYLCNTCSIKPLIVGVEPVGSVIFGGIPRPYKQNGTGLSFVPDNYMPDLVDVNFKYNDYNAFSMCRSVAMKEGLLLGGSSGSVLWAASEIIKKFQISSNANVVCVLPDSGLKYIDTIYNMSAN